MAIINTSDAQFIRDHFTKNLTGEVKITYFGQKASKLLVPTQECQYCEQTRQMIEELALLSDKLNLEIVDFVTDEERARQAGVERIPAVIVEGAAKGRVRFFGIPAGYEFAALVEDIVEVSRGESGLAQTTLDALAGLTEDVHIQVFSTPT